jgi:sugar O-acyltransferase (sialic acid O-acetyltransferase NeuD family)
VSEPGSFKEQLETFYKFEHRRHRKPVIIFGTGPTAKIVNYYLSNELHCSVSAFTVDAAYQDCESIDGISVVPFESVSGEFSPKEFSMFIAMGYQDLNAVREARVNTARTLGYELISVVHPQAHIPSNVEIGANCLILPMVALNPNTKVGRNVQLWNNVVAGHDCQIGDHCFISASATLLGSASVGKRCFIGANATITQGVTVEDDCFIGAGAIVTRNLESQSVVLGASSQVEKISSKKFIKLISFK